MSSCSLPSQSTIDTVVEALVTAHGPATRKDTITVLRAFPDPTIGGTADSPGAQPLTCEVVTKEEERALLEGQAADSLVPRLDGHGDTEPVEVSRGIRTHATMEGGREGMEGRVAAEGAATAAGAEASTPPGADWGLAEDAADDYPATHPLIRSTTDTDDPRETPYSLNTDGSPMYKRDLGVMGPSAHQPLVTLNTRIPTGFTANQGTDYIPFRIVSPVAFEPLEYPREEDSHAYSVTTKEELLDWVKNGDQTYRDLLVLVCVLASSPSSAFRYKSYADFFLIILDFCIAVWPQPSANRSLIQVGLIRPGRNITSPDGVQVEREACYVQVIMGPDPLVVGIIDESDKVYARPLYTAPRFTYSGKPIYLNVDMALFTEAFEDRAHVDRCLDAIHDPSLTVEVHRYRTVAREEEHLNQRIDDLIAALGEVARKATASRR
ncbi:hypothetical protein EDB85DRAFT_2149949 [Lactarius pseudohatsudake]|nr:hypothetical protein EDB85DRAFT_2149949 [Lactarius pseudohatsudake]